MPVAAIHEAKRWVNETVTHTATPKPIREGFLEHLNNIEHALARDKRFAPELKKAVARQEVYKYMAGKGIIAPNTSRETFERMTVQVPKKKGLIHLFTKEFWRAPIEVWKNPEGALKFLKAYETTETKAVAKQAELEKLREYMARHNIGGVTLGTPLEELKNREAKSTKLRLSKFFSPGYWGGRINIEKHPEEALKVMQQEYALQDLHDYMIRKKLIAPTVKIEELEKKGVVTIGKETKKWYGTLLPREYSLKNPLKVLKALKKHYGEK